MEAEDLAFFAAGILVGAVGAAALFCPEAKAARKKAVDAVRRTSCTVKNAAETVKKNVEQKLGACRAKQSSEEDDEQDCAQPQEPVDETPVEA